MTITEKERDERIKKSRELIRWTDEDYDSDQELKRPQPPLVKAAVSEHRIKLTKQYDKLDMEQDFVKILWKRRTKNRSRHFMPS